MERVTGLGGVFIRCKDPAAMTRWYHEHLGITPAPQQEGDTEWWQEAGPTVFAAVGDDGQTPAVRLNFRVRDLDAMLRQLSAAGASLSDEPEVYDFGRFAWVDDPEGNRIELWEPSSESLLAPASQQAAAPLDHP